MAIASTGGFEAEIGGKRYPLCLRNIEVERFERQHGVGIYGVWDSLFGRGPAPKDHQIRDVIALGLVGGGMSDLQADELVASQPPAESFALRGIAQRLLGHTFLPDRPSEKKKEAGSSRTPKSRKAATTPAPAS